MPRATESLCESIHRQKADMVFVPERPWEGTISPYSNIVEHEGIYKMWYLAHRVDASNKKPGDAVCTCYAESTNGIDWERPNLGLFSFEGVADTNIVMPGASPFVMIDPNGPDEHRYKSLSSVKETDRWSQTEGCIGSAYAYLESEKRWVEKTREEGGRGYKEALPVYQCRWPALERPSSGCPAVLPRFSQSGGIRYQAAEIRCLCALAPEGACRIENGIRRSHSATLAIQGQPESRARTWELEGTSRG